jgi:DNA-directed RNA polymerase subunit RPC12/RpoP
MASYQSCSWLCLSCRKPITYGITDKGPWALEKDEVTCAECGARISLTLTVKEDGTCTVSHRLLQ